MRKILPNKVIVVYQPKVVLGLKKKKKKISKCLKEQKDNMKRICWQKWIFFAMYIIRSFKLSLSGLCGLPLD